MSPDVLARLAVIMLTVALGAALARWKVLQPERAGAERGPAETLAQLTTYVLVPALLLRTTARMDLTHTPWPVVQAYFVPAMVCAWGVFLAQRLRQKRAEPSSPSPGPAAAATRTTAALYGNAVQLGIPLSAAMFGESGLAIHIALVSLHGLLLLTLLTVLAEYDVARAQGGLGLWDTVRVMLRSALLHPVVLPVLLGMGIRLTGQPLPAVADQLLAGLGLAAVPLSLLLIGMNLAQFGLRGTWRPALAQVLFKLLGLPAAVLLVAYGVFGLRGVALNVAVMMAALPVGSNALIFAQRYRLLHAEATAAIVLSTLAFALTAPAWLWVLAQLTLG